MDKKQTILITGGAGFIGSHLVLYMVEKYPHYHILNLDSLTYAADLSLLDTIACLLYTSPSPRDRSLSRMPSSA